MKISLWCIVVGLSVCLAAAKDLNEITELKVEATSAVEGCQRKSRNGDTISIQYAGSLATNGKTFDSSHRRGNPIVFQLGAGKVIKGWDQGLVGMCVGEIRTLVIPSTLAYGEQGLPPKIPANAPLLFEMELVNIYSKDEL